jgi:FkbH-like protein
VTAVPPEFPPIPEILRRVADPAVRDLPPLRLSILRNVMLEPIEPYLRYLALQSHFALDLRFGAFGNIYQEAAGADPSLVNGETDCVLIVVVLEALSWDLALRFPSLSGEARRAEIERVKAELAAVVRGVRGRTGALLLFTSLLLPAYPAFGFQDALRVDGQTAAIAELNLFLRDALRDAGTACLVDMNVLRARVGDSRFHDPRYWHIGKAPFAREALQALASESFRALRAQKGRNRKCLVLDCDNTLWGGVVGEEGLAGIALGRSHPGSAYVEFQHEVVNLKERGVLIALCSKNNPEDVWEVFRNHPDMVLREEHLATWRLDWNDKVANLRSIAEELNIGLDALVFLDDSAVEIGLVSQRLPQVLAVQLPPDRPADFRNTLMAGAWFDTLSVSDEDGARTEMYRDERARRRLREETPDLASYFRSLEMRLDVAACDAFTLPRIAQLTQKTNQFNLTTIRYTEAEIAAFACDRAVDVVSLRLRDRFGDSGIVGVAILRHEALTTSIDTFLLSCRVLGRGVESAFLSICLARAQARGATTVTASYRPTPKNPQVADFYARHGFQPSGAPCASDHCFRFDLAAGVPPAPDHFAAIETRLG